MFVPNLCKIVLILLFRGTDNKLQKVELLVTYEKYYENGEDPAGPRNERLIDVVS